MAYPSFLTSNNVCSSQTTPLFLLSVRVAESGYLTGLATEKFMEVGSYFVGVRPDQSQLAKFAAVGNVGRK